MICYVQFLKHSVCDICIYLYIHINEKKRTLGVTRGGRPTTTISRPSHILLIFSFQYYSIFPDKTISKESDHVKALMKNRIFVNRKKVSIK